jgi:threonine/homoserine/homoserine lactone efflux protein
VLSQAIGGLLPAAVAVALSPIPIIAVVVMLGTPRARSNGPAFAVGWVAGLVAVSVVVVLLAGGADDPGSTSRTAVDWLKVVLGVAFLVMAVRQWRRRPRAGQEPELPAWMATVDRIAPRRALVLGVALSAANPKNLALTMAAAASIAEVGLDGADTAIAVAVFVVLASVTVVGPVVFAVVDRARAAGPLDRVRQFMAANDAVIMMVILLVLGAKLLGDGFAGLQS